MRRTVSVIAIALALGLIGGMAIESPAYAWYGCGPGYACPMPAPVCYAPYCGPCPGWCPAAPYCKIKKPMRAKAKGKPAEKAKPDKPKKK